MMPRIRTAATISLIALSAFGAPVHGNDLEALSRSDQWQVRYCVPAEFDSATPLARTTLEKLAVDPDQRVALVAFAAYANLFIDIDLSLVQKAFARGDFDLPFVNVRDRPRVFRTPAFWRERLRTASDDNDKAGAVRVLGLFNDRPSIEELSRISTTNTYLLAQLAVAFRRLGSDERYLATLAKLFELTVQEAIYYQTFAVDCLLQTHPDRARAAWERIDKSISLHPDLQPNWVYGHAKRHARLP